MSLSLLAVLGLGVATQEGASLDLVPVLIGTFIVLLGIGSLFVYERPLHAVLAWAVKFSVAVTGRPRGDTVALIDSVIAWMTAVRLSWSQIGWIISWGTLNWLLDCACFAMMFPALGVPIPWKGLLLAYGAGQLAASLPITPGGLGVVEGSITVALVAFGGSEATTPYAVLLYRVISFWMILLVGWLFIGQLALQVRRGRWPRQALSSEVEAGPVAYEAPSAAATSPVTDGRCRVKPPPAAAAAAAVPALEPAPSSRPSSWPRPCWPRARPPVPTRAPPPTPATWPCRRRPRRSAATATSRACASTRSPTCTASPRSSTAGWPRDVPKKQAICVAGYSGHFTSAEVSKPLGHPSGTLAVAVVTTPGNRLLGTLVLSKIPVRFQHTFPFLG